MKIITLTLNPAIDVHCHTATFKPFKENHCTVTDRECGGKGVNISRALTVNGVDSLAFVVLGAENGNDFRNSLIQDGLTLSAVTVPGRIRENITLHCDDSDETRISFAGFAADNTLLEKIDAAVTPQVDDASIVTLTGSNPKGLSVDGLKELLRKWTRLGAKIVIDSRSFTLADLIEMKPWLIKPNQEEISAYLGQEIDTFDQVVAAARNLYDQGISNVMISLGPQGALLVCNEGVFAAIPPKIEALSTIGAGDSSIAGFLSVAEKTASDRLRTAVAFGTAACLTSGTKPPLPADVKSVWEKVTVNNI